MLHALLIDAEPFKRQIPSGPIMRLDGSRQKQRTLHIQIPNPALHDRQLQRDDAGHLDGAAKGDFAVALGEVEVADAELGAGDVHGQEDAAAAAQVLDVAVAAVLGAAGDGARALLADFVLERAGGRAGVDVLGLGRLGDDALELGRADELGFAAVPLGEDFGGGGAAEDAGVDEAGESQVRDVAGGAEDAFKVPNRFRTGFRGWSESLGADSTGYGLRDLRIWIDLVEKASPVVFVKYASKAPRLLLKWLHVLNFDDQNISRFGAFHLKGAGKVVDLGEIDVLHIVRAIVVADLPSCPIYALDLEDFSILDFGRKWNCRRGQWQLGKNVVEGISCHLDAICSEEGQRMPQ